MVSEPLYNRVNLESLPMSPVGLQISQPISVPHSVSLVYEYLYSPPQEFAS